MGGPFSPLFSVASSLSIKHKQSGIFTSSTRKRVKSWCQRSLAHASGWDLRSNRSRRGLAWLEAPATGSDVIIRRMDILVRYHLARPKRGHPRARRVFWLERMGRRTIFQCFWLFERESLSSRNELGIQQSRR